MHNRLMILQYRSLASLMFDCNTVVKRCDRPPYRFKVGGQFYLFLAVLGLHCCAQAVSSYSEQGLLSSCGAPASHGGGFSCYGVQALGHKLN